MAEGQRPGANLAVWQKWILPAWYAAAGFSFLPLAFHRMKAQDMWWHLAAGRLILERRAFVYTEPWSFARQGAAWLNHEWLSDVLYAAWAAAFGVESLRFWLLGIVTLTYLLLFDLLRRLTDRPLVSYAAAFLALVLARPFLEIRPHLYTLLGLVLILWIAWVRSRLILALPLVFLLWANLHSGFVLGLALLALALAAIAGREDREGERALSWRAAGVLWIACTLATLINPHGIRMLLFPFSYALGESPFRGLREWLSPFSPGALEVPWYRPALALFGVTVVAGLGSGRLRQRTPLGWPALAWGAGTALMSATSVRFVEYFGQGLALAVSAVLADWLSRSRRPEKGPWRLAVPLTALALGVGAVARLPLRHGFDVLTTLETLPVETCEFANANGLSGKVFTYFGWGGYLIWCSEGRLRPFIDARADTVYDAATLRRYLNFQDLRPGWESVPEATGADFVLWPTLPSPELPVVTHVPGLEGIGRWIRVHDDLTSALLVRPGVALPPLLKPGPPTPYRAVAEGAAAMRAGRMADAELHFARALAADPGLLSACRNLSLVQARLGKETAAWETHRRCERLTPEPEAANQIRALLARRRS